MNTIVLVNQTANYLFADIIKAFALQYKNRRIEAWYGSFDFDINELPENVVLSKGPEYNRNSFYSRFVSWVRFYVWMNKKIKPLDKKTTDFFFVSNPPLFVFLKGLIQLNFACLIYDLYPDVLNGVKKNRLINILSIKWAAKNLQVFAAARRIYTIGNGLKTSIAAYLTVVDAGKVEIVPVWNKQVAEEGHAIRRDFKKEWGLTANKVILYSGNIGMTHPLEHLIELAQKLQKYSEWKIVIVGNDTKKVKLESLAGDAPNIIFQAPVPIADLYDLLSIATWGYVTLDTAATNNSVPSKTYNLLAKGIPILALVNDGSDIAGLIKEHHVGISFKVEEMQNTVDKILSISNEEHKQYCDNARNCATHFTADLANKFTQNWLRADV